MRALIFSVCLVVMLAAVTVQDTELSLRKGDIVLCPDCSGRLMDVLCDVAPGEPVEMPPSVVCVECGWTALNNIGKAFVFRTIHGDVWKNGKCGSCHETGRKKVFESVRGRDTLWAEKGPMQMQIDISKMARPE